MNGTGVKWKELTTRAETERNALCKHCLQACCTFMQQYTRKCETAFNGAAWNQDRRIHHNLNKQNAERETYPDDESCAKHTKEDTPNLPKPMANGNE
jgi:hypothetical protein